MQKIYILSIFVPAMILLSVSRVQSQNCPKLKSAIIDGCGREGVNEFVMFQTRGQSVSLASIKVEYSTSLSFTPGASTVVINPNSLISAWKNPTVGPTDGLTNSLGTIAAINPTTTTTIAANSTVVIIPEGGALTNPYDLQLTGLVLVLFYDTTKNVGTSTSWTGTGNFSNYGNSGTSLNPRYFRLTTNAGGGCPATQAVSYTPSNLIRVNGTSGAQDGARANWDDAADATVTPDDNNGTVHYVNNGCTAITLPIKLISFQGTVSDGHDNLYWETASGSDAVTFRVDRSNDGSVYQTIGNIPAQEGDQNQQYSFTDANPLTGNNFYRLVMEDADHLLSYSNVVVLNAAVMADGISIYPNPVKGVVTISAGKMNPTATATLISSNGQVMLTRSFSGNNTMILDMSSYVPGLYLVRVNNGGSISSHKLFKL